MATILRYESPHMPQYGTYSSIKNEHLVFNKIADAVQSSGRITNVATNPSTPSKYSVFTG